MTGTIKKKEPEQSGSFLLHGRYVGRYMQDCGIYVVPKINAEISVYCQLFVNFRCENDVFNPKINQPVTTTKHRDFACSAKDRRCFVVGIEFAVLVEARRIELLSKLP